MQAWIVKHKKKLLLYLKRDVRGSLVDGIPELFYTHGDADAVRTKTDTPDDWKVVKVEITEQ